jgi:phage recombination protein Bet
MAMTKEEREQLEKDFNALPRDVPVTVVDVPKECNVEKVEHPMLSWSEEQLILLRATCAPTATDPEFKKLLYLSQVWQLDPMLREIWLVKFGNSPAQIYAGRDGFLKIAHRSGHFDGMETIVHFDENNHPVNSVCTVWRNDMTHPFKSDVLFVEYTTNQNLWKTKPSVMLGKCAESVALRKAFSVSGLYDPSEMGISD